MDKIKKLEALKKSLLNNKYEEVEKILSELSYQDTCDVVVGLAYDTKNISIYTFLVSLLIKKETADLHSLASLVFGTALFYMEGAYAAGLYHARRAVKLEPDRIEYKQSLLFYYDLPDNLMTKEEAVKIAQETLKIHPDDEYALEIISE